MKKLLTLSLLLFTLCLQGQVLTLDNLLYLYNKKFTVVNDYLINKKFDFIKSVDRSYLNKTIVYAKDFDGDFGEDRATEWINIYSNGNSIVYELAYQHTSKNDFNIFKTALMNKGFKQSSTDVEDTKIETVYTNKKIDLTTSINASSSGNNSYSITISKSDYLLIQTADSIRKADSTAAASAYNYDITPEDEKYDLALDIIIERDTLIHNHYMSRSGEKPIIVYSFINGGKTDMSDLDFGSLTKGTVKILKFVILNVSSYQINLIKFTSIDKAATVKFDKEIINSGEEATITITLNTKLAVVDSTSKLYANEINIDTTIGEIPLMIYGYIK